MKNIFKKYYWIFVSVFIVLLDQISKYLIVSNFDYQKKSGVITGFFNIFYTHNEGIGLGMLGNLGQVGKFIIIAVTLLMIVAAIIALFRDWFTHPLATIGLSFIIGGGIGNLIDRVVLRYVIDFLAFTIFGFDFWIFNVADIFVTVGTGILIVYLLFFFKEKSTTEEVNDANPEL